MENGAANQSESCHNLASLFCNGLEKRDGEAIAPFATGCYALLDAVLLPQPRLPAPSRLKSTGANMKLSINYKHVESHKPVEVEVARHVAKLEKLLKSYEPDLIQLHGGFSMNPRTEEVSCALTLSLPSGALRATGEAAAVRTSCKKAFSELESQVKKHQAKLRKDYEWKRKRPRIREEAYT